MRTAAERGDLSMVQCLGAIYGFRGKWGKELFTTAAEHGHVHLLEWARSQGFGIERHQQDVAESATYSCRVAVLKWLHQHYDTAYDSQHLKDAVSDRPQSLETCQYLVSTGCEVTLHVCEAAAKQKDCSILQWFYESGACELNSELCTAAAEHHRLKTLKWLHEEVHCPWNLNDCARAAVEYSKSHTVLQYLCEQGLTLTAEQLTDLLKRSVSRVQHDESDLVCAKWLRSQGALWPAVLSCTRLVVWGQELFGDWPEAAVRWCRSEGCTAPLLSEVQPNDE